MAPKRASKQQQQLNVDQFKLLKKPMDHLGKQINVPGSFWEGRMLQDERDKVYKCTIVDFSLAHKFAPDSSPRNAFKMQEMGIDGTGSHEESDLASTMYWIDYPLPFLRFYYNTFPAVDDGLAGAAEVASLARAASDCCVSSATDVREHLQALEVSNAEISCQSIFATFPSPHFPRAAATLPQHGIDQFHVLCILKRHHQKVCNQFSPPCDFYVQRTWN
jgi:hypothetical protein